MLPALLGQVRAFAARELDALAADRAGRFDRETLPALADLGLFGLTLPQRFGGSDLGLPATCAVIAALAEVDRSVAVTLGLHLGLGTRGLVAWGTSSLQSRFLPDLATGRRIAAFAATEPGAGSDLTALATTLRDVDGRKRLSGQKAYVTNGGLAGVVTVAASSPGPGALRGLSLVVLNPRRAGVSVGAEEHKLGLRASSTTALYFDDVEVEADAVLGGASNGAAQLSHLLSWGRLLMSAGCVGAARAALRRAVVHTGERRQFGGPLARQEVVRLRLGTMSAQLFAMQALVEAAAHAEDEATLVRLSTSAKLFCSEAAGQICDLSLQLHGGSGYLEDTGLALLVRDARVTRIFEGANDVLWTHRGLIEATAPAQRQSAAPTGRATLAADALREVLKQESGVRLLGKKEALHRLGQAAMWKDSAEAAWAAARTPAENSLAAGVEALALTGISQVGRRAVAPTEDSEWQTALDLEWHP